MCKMESLKLYRDQREVKKRYMTIDMHLLFKFRSNNMNLKDKKKNKGEDTLIV